MKRLISFGLVICMALSFAPEIKAIATNKTVSPSAIEDFVQAAEDAGNKRSTRRDLSGDPIMPYGYSWCGFFVGWAINHSALSRETGNISQNDSRFAKWVVNWGAKNNYGVIHITAGSTTKKNESIYYNSFLGDGVPTSNILIDEVYLPERGDLVLFDWVSDVDGDFDHIGIMISPTQTIEGNSGDGTIETRVVRTHNLEEDSYRKTQIIGYFHFSTCNHTYQTIKKTDGTYTAVCKKCSEEFPIVLNNQITTCEVIRTTPFCAQPYQEAKGIDAKRGEQYTVVGYADNAYGNRWYKLQGGQWLYGEHISVNTPSVTVSLSGTGSPGNLSLGAGGHLSGSINASGGTISSIMAQVFTEAGVSVLGPKTANNISSNATSYNLNSSASGSIDMQLAFGSVTSAGKYYIKYTVTTSDGKTTEIESSPFQIGTVTPTVQTAILHFIANGGSVSESLRQVPVGSQYGSLPIPVRDGYDFDGWYTSDNVWFGKDYSSAQATQNLALFAHWTERTPAVTVPSAHVHTYEQGYEAAHPHRVYMVCTGCGDYYYTGATTTIDSCATCNPPVKADPVWGAWSDWSATPVTASSTRQVETQQVKISDAYTQYRYGRYVDPTGKHDCWCATYFRKIGYTPILQYSDWSTTRYSVADTGWTCGYCGGDHIGAASSSGGKSYWNEYRLSNGSYYWEESRTIPATYQTQYRYRDLQ